MKTSQGGNEVKKPALLELCGAAEEQLLQYSPCLLSVVATFQTCLSLNDETVKATNPFMLGVVCRIYRV